MLILTNENKSFDLNKVGHELSEDVYYGVFDFADKHNPDYYFRPLSMIETFNSVGIEFRVGNYKIILPNEWSIVLGDPEMGDVELLPVDEVNVRDFHALCFNPVRGGIHNFLEMSATDVFTDVGWCFPRLNFHNFLLVPLSDKENPDCIMIINEKDQKKIPQLDLDIFLQ